MLEKHYTGKKAISCPIPDSLINPFLQQQACVILQLISLNLLQNGIYILYIHFIQQRLIKKDLLKDPSKQNYFMLSIVC